LRDRPRPSLFPYTTLFRSLIGALIHVPLSAVGQQAMGDVVEVLHPIPRDGVTVPGGAVVAVAHLDRDGARVAAAHGDGGDIHVRDRKSTRLNSSHVKISYA